MSHQRSHCFVFPTHRAPSGFGFEAADEGDWESNPYSEQLLRNIEQDELEEAGDDSWKEPTKGSARWYALRKEEALYPGKSTSICGWSLLLESADNACMHVKAVA